ncbi:aldo/keto reductase [Kitasatospora sp. NBC_00070]|uniref:aldo/keto reductase n=1 Tax=Kitasatospora sp. NBC_00070 TaxID=2975962 RepID=UPI0032523B19
MGTARAAGLIRLGSRTDVEVTELGLGLAPIGGLYRAVGDRSATATVDRAWEHGIRFFDTAPLYGYGLSEQRAGRALAGRPRAGFTLSTKVGLVLEPGGPDTQEGWPEGELTGVAPRFDFSYRGTHQALEQSLARLGTDHVELLHIHDADRHYQQAMAGSYRALAELRAAGVVRAISVGLTQAPLLARFAEAATDPPFDCVLVGGRYTLLDQSALDELLPLCVDRRITVIAGGVYNSGVLAAPVAGSHFHYEPATDAVLARARAVEAVCGRYGVPLRTAALQFPLGHPAVRSVLVGARSPEQVDDSVAMFELPVPGALWADLKGAGLLPEHAPTPQH